MLTSSYLANHLLIAMPGLDDPNFSRGVTLMCQHNADGALGIVVNRLSNFKVLTSEDGTTWREYLHTGTAAARTVASSSSENSTFNAGMAAPSDWYRHGTAH